MPRGRAPTPGTLTRALAGILSAEVAEQALTQRSLARTVGISQSQVGKFLRAERTLDLEQLDRFCFALGLKLRDVVTAADKLRRL